MIAFLKGNFVRKTPALVHVEVNGVGYELHISLNTFSSIANLDHGMLHTYLHIREDAHILYGFYEEAEKEMFIQMISVSGVGAATARIRTDRVRIREGNDAQEPGDHDRDRRRPCHRGKAADHQHAKHFFGGVRHRRKRI